MEVKPEHYHEISPGMQFGAYTVIEKLTQTLHVTQYVLCRCVCGEIKEIPLHLLAKTKIKQCRCVQQLHGLIEKELGKSCRPLSVAEAAYLAGLIDGEGYIGIKKSSSNATKNVLAKRGFYLQLLIMVSSTTRNCLDFACQKTGLGTVRSRGAPQNERHKPSWVWRLDSTQAASFISEILPYLIVKAEHAKNALRFQGSMHFAGPRQITDKEWALRLECLERARELNRRGKAWAETNR